MFTSARLKLTIWYVFIIMLISISFSLVIYRYLTHELNRFSEAQRVRIERRLLERNFLSPGFHTQLFSVSLVDPDLILAVKNRIRWTLLLINIGILSCSAALAYFLAGRTLAPIKDMMEEQNRFISDASHEFRTPLTSLKSALEVYLRAENPTRVETRNLIDESLKEVNKLQSLSDSLLSLAQYQKPNSSLKFEKLPLEQIMDEAIKKTNLLARKKKLTIIKQTPAVEVIGNRYGLIDLLVILLDNAIKYSGEGKTIWLTAKKTAGQLKISVKDEGVGIAAKDLPHIFDRFYRADTTRSKSEIDGYGLGLSIAQKIVKNHKGKISIKSKIGTGSTFTVILPTG